MSITTSQQMMKKKLEEIKEYEGEKALKKIVVAFELPFVVDEEDLKRFFSKIGPLKSVQVIRSGALIFSTAIVEFQKKSAVSKAIQLALHGLSFSGEFEIVLYSAEDFLEGKRPLKPQRIAQPSPGSGDDVPIGEIEAVKKEKCKVQ